MSMFRRPTDVSSDSATESEHQSDDEDESFREEPHNHSNAGSEEFIGPNLTATETLSSGESISVTRGQDTGPIANAEHHRNMMLASLLEEFYKSRAAELFNAATPGATYHRQSSEVQPLAKTLFAQASQDLVNAGILTPSAISGDAQSARGHYILGFNNLGLQNLRESNLLPESMQRRISNDDESNAMVKAVPRTSADANHFIQDSIRDLAIRSGNTGMMSHPKNDLQLLHSQQRYSHYRSSFLEAKLLGKGGFGRVYQTYNLFDKREYAVKKIPLSPALSRRYQEHGHSELHNVLREVQALAQLEHCNVVRYHATWIEEPSRVRDVPDSQLVSFKLQPTQRLLTDKPALSMVKSQLQQDEIGAQAHEDYGRVLFEADSRCSGAAAIGPGWSQQFSSQQADQSSFLGSEIFTDGVARQASQEKIMDDPYCYVLHVQMSMYPATLSQYLQPLADSSKQKSILPNRRHCFHLLPSLQLLLGILCGLQYIHTKGLVHRDIKPSNIFLSTHEFPTYGLVPEGYHDVGACQSCKSNQPFLVNPRIGDFGLVADLAHLSEGSGGSSPRRSAKTVGTQYYYPPSDAKGKGKSVARAIDEKLDVFALGVIFVEMLCSCSTSMERLELLKGLQDGRTPTSLPKNLNNEHGFEIRNLVEELILGMIDKNAATRWSCNLVKERLEMILRLITE